MSDAATVRNLFTAAPHSNSKENAHTEIETTKANTNTKEQAACQNAEVARN